MDCGRAERAIERRWVKNDLEIPIRRQDTVRDTAHYVKAMRDDIDRYAAIIKKLNWQIR